MTRIVLHAHATDRFTRATSATDGHVHGIRSWLMDDTLWNTDSGGTLHRHHLPPHLPGHTSEPIVNVERHERNGT